MNIIVCIKQVPDSETRPRIASGGESILEEDIKWIVNPYDEFAVEEALRIREKFGGEVTIIGAGPPRVAGVIRTALAMGADKGVLINDPAIWPNDSPSIARVVARVIEPLDFDLIFTGQKGIDADSSLFGAALAEYLDLPQISLAVKVDVADDCRSVRTHTHVEGQTLIIESGLPALITAQKGLNEPRYTSLPGIMKAKRKPLEEKSLAELGMNPSNLGADAAGIKIIELTYPPHRKPGKIIEGNSPGEKAEELVKLLRFEAGVL